ncbi:MAG: F0F1 ATP synthase subunit B [Candidatus Omnitrophica bacterium]|nr:F0F1 ATP synthase subunit B [Candidatus Omnitrophota bacterium]
MNLNATLIIEVLSFLILLGLLIRFLYRPVLNVLDKRAAEIKEANQKIQENLCLAEKKRERTQQLLAESKNQALKIREKAGLEAEQLRQKIISQAGDEAARTLRASQQEIVNQAKKAKEELKAEAIDLSLKAAEKILRRKFASEDQKRLIKELTEGISERSSSGR